jgi:hypothetical protein
LEVKDFVWSGGKGLFISFGTNFGKLLSVFVSHGLVDPSGKTDIEDIRSPKVFSAIKFWKTEKLTNHHIWNV